MRDRFNVPHIYGKTNDDVTFGAGWALAQDRTLLLEQARYNARVAAVDAPGLEAIDLITRLKSFQPSAQTEREVAKEAKILRERYGKRGRRFLHDIDVFIKGINAQYRKAGSKAKPWKRNDVIALNAVKSELFGEGGGSEVRAAQLLDGLQDAHGADRGLSLWNDLRQRQDPETPVSVKGNFPYSPLPKNRSGNVVVDNGSFQPIPVPGANAAKASTAMRRQASNILMVAGKRSKSGNPLFVGGPQIGYFYPGLTLEMDLHGPGWTARGATSAPFPGYILIGRREDFAWTLTSAGADIVDIFIETLCEGSDTKYLYKGKCRDMTPFNAGTLDGQPVRFDRTMHGPVVGYASVNGTARGGLAKALELPARRRRPAALPAPDARQDPKRARLHRRRLDLASDVQHVLRRPRRSGHDHHRAPADPGQGSRPGPAHRRPRLPRVARLPQAQGPPAGDRALGRAEQLEQQAGARVPRLRRPVGLRGDQPRRPAQHEHRQARQAHAGHAHRCDERGRHAGRARGDLRAAAGRAAQGRCVAEPARHAHARAARGLAREGRQPPGCRT